MLSLSALTEFQLEEERVCTSCLKAEMLVVPKACCDFTAEGYDTAVTSTASIFERGLTLLSGSNGRVGGNRSVPWMFP